MAILSLLTVKQKFFIDKMSQLVISNDGKGGGTSEGATSSSNCDAAG